MLLSCPNSLCGQQAIRQRGLPFEGIHVLHFDAHPDLSFPRCVDPALVFQPAELYDALDESVSGDAKAYSTFVFSLLSLARYSLSDCVLTGAGIAEFLLPLVYAGHVNQITWIKPHWAKQVRHTPHVVSVFGGIYLRG